MNPLMQVPYKKKGKYAVGDRVRIIHGFKGMIGEVVEDRGNIGVNAERIYAVDVRMDEWNVFTIEFSESDLEPVDAKDLANGKPK